MFQKASMSIFFTSAVMVIPIPCLLLHQCLQLWRLQKTEKRILLILSQQMEIFKWNTTLISCSLTETEFKWPEILCPIPEAMSHTAARIIWVCSFLIIELEWHFSFFHSLQSFMQDVYVYIYMYSMVSFYDGVTFSNIWL